MTLRAVNVYVTLDDLYVTRTQKQTVKNPLLSELMEYDNMSDNMIYLWCAIDLVVASLIM